MQDNKDNNNVNDIDNKNADNSTDTSTTEKKDEYEKVCYVCHRTESRAGKMINMGNNIYICPDCMQRSFDAIYNSGINYDDMMKNIPGMGNIPGMNGFMSGDMNDNISQKQKIKKKNNKDDKDKKEDIDLKNIPAPHVIKEMLDQYVATKESIADSKKKLETEKAELIRAAYDKMMSREEYQQGVTDDAMVVETMTDHKVRLTEGSYRNIKVTTPEDMEVAAAFLKNKKS